MSFFASEADSPWSGGPIDTSARLPFGIPPVNPTLVSFGVPMPVQGTEHRLSSDQVAAKCDGFPAGCQSGGSYGTTGMYTIGGKNLCRDCAVKILGIGNESGPEQQKTLNRFLPILPSGGK